MSIRTTPVSAPLGLMPHQGPVSKLPDVGMPLAVRMGKVQRFAQSKTLSQFRSAYPGLEASYRACEIAVPKKSIRPPATTNQETLFRYRDETLAEIREYISAWSLDIRHARSADLMKAHRIGTIIPQLSDMVRDKVIDLDEATRLEMDYYEIVGEVPLETGAGDMFRQIAGYAFASAAGGVIGLMGIRTVTIMLAEARLPEVLNLETGLTFLMTLALGLPGIRLLNASNSSSQKRVLST